VLPKTVLQELLHTHAPPVVRNWSARLPAWIEVRESQPIQTQAALDPGEVEAIAQAKELKADYVLLDDRDARREAVRHGLVISGTVGVLERAAEKDLLDLSEAFRKLLATNFRVDRQLVAQALARDTARKKRERTHERDRDIER
jgi:predicted nucleic acid-binding protein